MLGMRGAEEDMKLNNKTRKKIARCAEDQRFLLDLFERNPRLSQVDRRNLDEVYGLALKMGILTEAKHGERGSERRIKASKR